MAVYFVGGLVAARSPEEGDIAFQWSGVIDLLQPLVFKTDLQNLRGMALERIQKQEGYEDYDIQNITIWSLSQLDVAKYIQGKRGRKFFYWMIALVNKETENNGEAYEMETLLELNEPILSEDDLKNAEMKIMDEHEVSQAMAMNIEFLFAA